MDGLLDAVDDRDEHVVVHHDDVASAHPPVGRRHTSLGQVYCERPSVLHADPTDTGEVRRLPYLLLLQVHRRLLASATQAPKTEPVLQGSDYYARSSVAGRAGKGR